MQLRNGYSVAEGGMVFEFSKDKIVVKDGHNFLPIDEISVLRDGLPEVTTVVDFESQVMFWLDEYNLI